MMDDYDWRAGGGFSPAASRKMISCLSALLLRASACFCFKAPGQPESPRLPRIREMWPKGQCRTRRILLKLCVLQSPVPGRGLPSELSDYLMKSKLIPVLFLAAL